MSFGLATMDIEVSELADLHSVLVSRLCPMNSEPLAKEATPDQDRQRDIMASAA